MPRGGSIFRNNVVGWTTTTLTGTAASFTITPPAEGTHLEIEISGRSDQTGAAIASARLQVNGDTTNGNYHTQWVAATNGSANVPEASSQTIGQHPTADSVAGFFGFIYIRFPFFRMTDRQKVWIAEWATETAAANASYGSSTNKRQTAGVGALTDAITSIVILPGANNWIAGTVYRWRVVS